MQNQFEQRVKKYSQEFRSFNKRYNLIATIRILVFIIFLIAFVCFANFRMGLAMGLTALTFPFVFGLIVNLHQKIKYKWRHARYLKEINETEIDLLEGKLKQRDSGEEYLDKTHFYAGDLDIFGSNSIYQLLNRTATKGGKDKLASWLLNGAEKTEILERQNAIEELTEQVDWRQDFQARGMHFEMQKTNSNELIQWIKTAHPMPSHFKIAAYVLPPLIVVSIFLNIFTAWPVFITILIGVINGAVLNRFQKQIELLTESVIKHIAVLGAYGQLIDKIERSNFSSDRLQKLKSAFTHDNVRASSSIKRLYSILDFLNARSNFFYMIIDVVFLFDLHIILLAEQWKKKNESDVAGWFDSISEMEVINSLAGYQYANPKFIVPKISDVEYDINAIELGHPLIKSDERVANNYQLSGKGNISIITGSNMSGKSTFLRTLGVNLVLAQAGAAVCAKSFRFSLLQIFTSMRTQDNLEEHVSSFYAELQRIKLLLELVDQEKPVLYMLDEILKGTNSQDRHIGAVSLAKQLSKTNSFGLISTHDLALGELAKTKKTISNYSFNSIVEDDEIYFPYKLENGICHSFNASKLMEKIGIEISKE